MWWHKKEAKIFVREDDAEVKKKELEALAFENENITLFDVRNYPGYISDVRGNGMYMEDVVHYTGETNIWVAGEILKVYKEELL